MVKSLAAAVVLAQVLTAVSAVLSGGGPTCSLAGPLNADFDSVPDSVANPGSAFNTIPAPYLGLAWPGLTYAYTDQVDHLPFPGLNPQSPPGVAVAGLVSATSGGTPMMTVDYSESTVSYFKLYSFYYACAFIDGQPCSITATAYTQDSECSQVFDYTPSPSTETGQSDMAWSNILHPCFQQEVTHVDFSYTPTGDAEFLGDVVAMALDNVDYDTYSCPSTSS